MQIAEKLNYVDFNASSGWLERFKKRNNITFRAISGESTSVNQDDARVLLKKCRPASIYDADYFFEHYPIRHLH